MEACESLDQKFVNIIKEAEEKIDMWLVIKGNNLKRKSEENRKEVEILNKTIHVPEQKRKKLQWTIIW